MKTKVNMKQVHLHQHKMHHDKALRKKDILI